MLGRDAALSVPYVLHHEWVNKVVKSLLQGLVVVAWYCDIQMQVAITDVAIPKSDN